MVIDETIIKKLRRSNVMLKNIFDGARIEERRKEMNLSKAELCRRAGINRSTYYKLIFGETVRMPSALYVFDALEMDFPQAVKKNEG